MKLSDHFSLREAERSHLADRLGIDNHAPAEIHTALIEIAANILEPIREAHGAFSPSSWYRSLALNRAVGSKDSSQHVLGEACDIEIIGVSNIDLAHWIAGSGLDFDQLILEFYNGESTSGWVHVSFTSRRKNRNEILTIGKSGTVRGLPE